MKLVRNEIGGLGNLLFKESYIWAQMRNGEIPDIYVQSSEYWDKYKEEIKQRFSSGIGYDSRVALHIRRGDYLKVSQFHVNLWDTDYYKKAIDLFLEGTKFLVFCKDNQSEAQDTDDREWCLRNVPLLNIDFEMYEHGKETDDLNAMASCKGIIGANSSFSWWAAFLNSHNGLKVFPAENKWFVDGNVRTKLEKEWAKI
jgi:hypothetical protein